MSRIVPAVILFGLTLIPLGPALATPNCGDPPEMMIIVDRSGSMTGMSGSQSKWAHATSAVKGLTTKFAGQIRFALMVFPGPQGSCDPGVANVSSGLNNHVAISAFLNSTYPTGLTPIGASLKNADTILSKMPTNKTKYALLITDGSETCSGKAIDWVKKMMGAQIKTYVVGFGSGVSTTELNNLAQAGGTPLTGTTNYYKADNAAQLNSALQSIGSQVSCCGNGVLDAGEKCDKAAPAGSKGACPKSAKDCDDKKACTNDYLVGTECAITCGHSPVNTPKHGDGCCPPGANSKTDNDCPVACGNGVLEPGEACDPGIKSGAGKCKVQTDCNDKDICTKDQLAGSACQVKCQNTPLTPNTKVKDGCCPAGNTLDTDLDCKAKCGPDKTKNCIDLCKGVTCPDGHYCNNGKCIPWPSKPGTQDGGTEPVKKDSGTSNPKNKNDAGGATPNTPGPGAMSEAGCACHQANLDPSPAALWLLFGLALLAARRRR